MKRSAMWILLSLNLASLLASETTTSEIDRDVWSIIAATVMAQDIDGMAVTYHPDAVLVSPRGTVAIADQLVKWGRGMEEAKASGATARVEFRFQDRQDGDKTAFERGMFKYTEMDNKGEVSPVFISFESLLVKKDGRWLVVMERQLEELDEAAWEAME